MLIVALLILVLPLLFQLYYGYKAATFRTDFSFWIVVLVSIISHGIVTIISLSLGSEALSDKGIRCGMPLVGLIGISFLAFIGILVTAVIQFIVATYYNKGKTSPSSKIFKS